MSTMRYQGLACVIGIVIMTASPAGRSDDQASAPDPPARRFQEALTLMDARGDLEGAIRLFEEVARSADRRLAAHAWLHIGACYERLGRRDAQRVYEQVIEKYPDEGAVVQQARRRLAVMTRPAPAPAAAGIRHGIAWVRPPEGEPSRVSLDGTVVAFRSGHEFSLVNPSTGTPGRTVTMKPAPPKDGALYDPAILSPDGSEAAFILERSDGSSLLGVMQLDTGAWRTIVEIARGDWLRPLEWSARARLFAIRSFPNGRTRSEIVDPDKGSSRVVADHDGHPVNASLSPDGQFVVFDAPTANGLRDIFIASGGSRPRVLVAHSSDDVMPLWAPDGSRVIFTTDRTGRTSLWAVDIDQGQASGDPYQLFHDSGVSGLALGMTDAGSLYYVRQVGLVNVYRVELDSAGQPASPPVLATERFLGTNLGSAWGPGGTLAHLTRLDQTLTQQIAIHGPSGDVRVLDTRLRQFRLIKWSPDGQSILVKGSNSAREYGLHLIDPENGSTRSVLTVPPAFETSIGQIGWGNNALTVLYVRDAALIARDLISGGERPVIQVNTEAAITGFDTHPTTGAIAYVESRRSEGAQHWSLRVREPDGRDSMLFAASDRAAIQWPSWMPDGRAILVVRPVAGAAREGEVWRIDRQSGAAMRLGIAMPTLRNIDVSEDGRQLTFTSGSPGREAWVLENFIPVRGGAR